MWYGYDNIKEGYNTDIQAVNGRSSLYKALGNAMKEVGSTLLNVGKQALNSYADYEQLIGGVETLFKENASTIENYANNAYKTAGLSANEYMETVTSFSAVPVIPIPNNCLVNI